MTLLDLGRHAGFILSSYGLTAFVVAGLILWIRLDFARQKKMLRALEAQGVTRRSAADDKTAAS